MKKGEKERTGPYFGRLRNGKEPYVPVFHWTASSCVSLLRSGLHEITKAHLSRTLRLLSHTIFSLDDSVRSLTPSSRLLHLLCQAVVSLGPSGLSMTPSSVSLRVLSRSVFSVDWATFSVALSSPWRRLLSGSVFSVNRCALSVGPSSLSLRHPLIRSVMGFAST